MEHYDESGLYIACPDHIPKLHSVPDTLAIHDFLFKEDYGRHPKSDSKPPFICGLTGSYYTVLEVERRIEQLACALAKDTGWQVNEGTVMDKAIDTVTVSWAVHRLNGVSCPTSHMHSAQSLSAQLKTIGCKVLFASAPLIPTALEAAASFGIPRQHVFVIEVPRAGANGMQMPSDLKTVNQLIQEGARLGALPALQWPAGQGARQTAFLMSSSGTTGHPKNVCITHKNVISNILQFLTFERSYREEKPQTILNVLPLSHALALILAAHHSTYRGDSVVMMDRFDLHQSLSAIEKHKVEILWMTPPLIFAITGASSIVKTYDISSVQGLRVGAASIDKDTLERFKALIPGCDVIQGYGLTETSSLAVMAHRGRQRELIIRGGSIVPGYYNDADATKMMLTPDGWLRTGDLCEFRRSTKGHSNLFVLDRIKELIKVHGMQVAPAEIEAFLRSNRLVADLSIVPVPSDLAGEVPRAYVINTEAAAALEETVIQEELHSAVNAHFPPYKRLSGGIAFVTELPRTPAGKVRRDLVRQMARKYYEVMKKGRELESFRASAQLFTFDTDDDEDEDD
ncbi:hypothetical protein PG994_013751 [Apiospora phragmitis]|uniref:Uncharacterized protein n=1 Tax=Apiospora phragmitis TaxID=2905665 RepID=A0ABR1T4D4_9PEZI